MLKDHSASSSNPPVRSSKRLLKWLGAAVFGSSLLVAGCGGGSDPSQSWVGTWSAAPTGPADATVTAALAAPFTFTNQTVRMIVRSSVDGSQVRVRLSNEIGNAPSSVLVNAAQVALRSSGSSIVAGSSRALTFNGQTSVTIPPKGFVLSDPVKLDVPALADLAISLHLPGPISVNSFHAITRQTNYVSAAGNFVDAATMPTAATSPYWYLLSGVDVVHDDRVAALVAFGDSITDGFGEQKDRVDAPTPWPSWPSRLAERLQANDSTKSLAVLNAGIAGNRILNDAALSAPLSLASLQGYATAGPSALSRFQRDVVGQANASCVVVLLGINDIGQGPARGQVVTADQIIAGHQQIIAKARSAGLSVIGATLTPFAGFPAPYYSADNEAKRQAVNAWIRGSKSFDAVIDFDAVVKDPAVPTQLLASFDSGDHLHPSDAGYQAMANSIDLPTVRGLCFK
ncbi:MAG: GDSL family lipase [Burkholderiales bacterium PBB4]|nr:MAG: GDSL family lipase [Burkholderiales bacterium PBB4]